jgi:hypothetical protein
MKHLLLKFSKVTQSIHLLLQEYLPMVPCVEREKQMLIALPHKLEHEFELLHCW